MHTLIGDIGNTLTKICLIEVKTFKIKKIVYFDSKKNISSIFLKKKLKSIIRGKKMIKLSLFSSVVPKYQKKLAKILYKFYQIKLIEIKNKNIKKIVKINLRNKNQVGSDRIANSVGAFKKYNKNCIILDFGTATTFDLVTKNGIYNGGIIAPGINLSINSLTSSADQIPIFSLKKQNKVVGKNTKEALRAGFYWGYSGLINNIISKIEKETKKKYKIIFTGGFADLFKASIVRPFDVDKNITIKGIIEIFKENIKYLNK